MSPDALAELSRVSTALVAAVRSREPLRFRMGPGSTGHEATVLLAVAGGTSEAMSGCDAVIEEIRLAEDDPASSAPLLLLSHRPRWHVQPFMPAAFSNHGTTFLRLPGRLVLLSSTVANLVPLTKAELRLSRQMIVRRRFRRRAGALRHRLSSVVAALMAAARAVDRHGYDDGPSAPLPAALAGLRRDWMSLDASLDGFCGEVERVFGEIESDLAGGEPDATVSEMIRRVRAAAHAFARPGAEPSLRERSRELHGAVDALKALLEKAAGGER